MTNSRLVNSHHFPLWWDSSQELAGCVLSWLPLLLECKVMSNQVRQRTRPWNFLTSRTSLPHATSWRCLIWQKAAWWRFNPDTNLKKRCFYWHWLVTEWKAIGLSSIKQRTLKKNNKETLWTFISWRKLLKLKTSKAIPGRETLRKNILGFGHTQKKILKCVLSYKKQSTWWQETNTKLCIYIYTALLKHNNSTHW